MKVLETPSLASSVDTAQPSQFRILSLDGGGAKGVYTLGVLKEVEALCGRPLCEVFDLIYGTSTGSIIASLIALGYPIAEIEKIYLDSVPRIMRHRTACGRTKAVKTEARKLFGTKDFSAFKTYIGIVCTNHGLERPMVFKNSVKQAHGSHGTFKPGFGCTIADAVIASCAAYPFFDIVTIPTENQGDQVVMDGGYVANNPTLFALADARNALKIDNSAIRVLSVGVGSYNEPKKTVFHRLLFSLPLMRHTKKMFNISSKTIEVLRSILFPNVHCVRISDAYPDPRYATDLLEDDVEKLKLLIQLGRESYGKQESDIKTILFS